MKILRRIFASAALLALAACSASTNNGLVTPPVVPPGGGLSQQNFVGVGDSLTFGQQSSGQLGDATATAPGISALPGAAVPPTQQNGFWALMYKQITGNSAAASGVLPLIAKPGLGGQLVVSALAPGFAATHLSCDSFNALAFGATTWPQVRLNATSPVADLGIPGLTMHEAIGMNAPITGPPPAPVNNACPAYAQIPGDSTSGGLQSLIADESKLFYPVLGQFSATVGPNATELSSAVSLKPKIVTVWLGANDLLKFIFSHGQSPITDSPSQMATDLGTIIAQLQATGAQVVVGDLPDILGNPGTEPPVPQFFPASKISADLQALGVPAAAAGAVQAYVIAKYTGATGFLTESGFFSTLSQVAGGSITPNLDPNGAGSGDGPAYLDSAFSATVIALNAGYNQAIDATTVASGAALAPITTAFRNLAATGYTVAPGVTLTMQFGGGLLSYDGLHPSNTGYALIANVFIGAYDTKFSGTVAQLTPAQIASIASGDSYNPFVIKSINPAWPYPLP